MAEDRGGFARRRVPAPSEPDLPAEFKRVITVAIQWGWAEVTRRWPDVVMSGREEQITERLQLVLNELDENDSRCAPGLQLFDVVDRGPKVTTSDGRIEKAPDLVFRPPNRKGVQNLGDWGLFVECKIVDAAVHHHAPTLYCNNGVARFVKGEYAHRMGSGMMLAFVRDRSLPHPTLNSLLDEALATLSHRPGDSENESTSEHDRSAQSCVSIALMHLWLQSQTCKQ